MPSTLPHVTVLGAGYVGLTTAALLTHAGYHVYIVEPDSTRLDVIKQGRSFFYEHGLDPLIQAALDTGRLVATDSYEASIPLSDVVFSCVGTPENPDGSSNLSYVFAAAKETAEFAKDGLVYAQKSTVPVGTGKEVVRLFAESDKPIAYVSNPEFLREGTAIQDTLFFDRVVVGGHDASAIDVVLEIYMELEKYRDHIAHIARIPTDSDSGEYITTSLNSAELIKVTANAFLALKISFSNSIAKLADQADADIVDVMQAVGADPRIGRSFLQAGRGYGGGCFPKDVSGLIASGLDHGVDLEIMHAAQALNESMPGYVVEQISDAFDGILAGKIVAVLGLAFKAGTSDVRRSPGVSIANKLMKAGAVVRTYDPQAMEEASTELEDSAEPVETIEDAITGADVVVIATEWRDFLDYPPGTFTEKMNGTLLFDAVNQYDSVNAVSAGLTYVGVGRRTGR